MGSRFDRARLSRVRPGESISPRLGGARRRLACPLLRSDCTVSAGRASDLSFGHADLAGLWAAIDGILENGSDFFGTSSGGQFVSTQSRNVRFFAI